jgi:integrase
MEKGNQDRELSMAPEFVKFLEETPPAKRTGRVFKFYNGRQKKWQEFNSSWIGKVVCKIGEKSRVVVDKKSGKFASAHDLRRSFGQRWSTMVMLQVLMELMRHNEIATTLKYYVGANARATSSVLWEAFEAKGNTLGNTAQKATKIR